jgi:hypothetical protein
MTSTVQFTTNQIEEAAGAGPSGVRQLVQLALQPEWGDTGSVFQELVDQVLGLLDRILTQTDGNAPPASATKPGLQETWWRGRPQWCTEVSFSFHPPQRGNVCGTPSWRQD